MKTLKKYLSILLITLTGLFSTSSCTEDFWYSDVDGEWKIVEVNGTYNCNYQSGDHWYFYGNGDFEARGYGNLYEQGLWERRNRTINISFNGRDIDLQTYIDQLDSDYMVLRVDDYTFNTRYTLRMVRVGYLGQKKQD